MKYCYCIFYIDRKYYKRINPELKRRGYKHIRSIVPTVRVLKKSIKNRTFYEEVPVLFNYGFIKMPIEKAFSRPFLNRLKRDIPGIRNWLRSTASMFSKKKKRRIDNAEDWDDFSKVAICSRDDVIRFKNISRNNDKYSLEEILNLQEGQYVYLKIYPYEGVEAKIIAIYPEKELVRVELYPQMGKFTADIPLDHILYSVYKDCDPNTFINPLKIEESKLTENIVNEAFNKSKRHE